MKRKLLFNIVLCAILCGISTRGVSQYFHFTQFDKSPLTLNPALAGSFYGDLRVYSLYRSQWAGVLDKPFSTYSIGIQKPIYLDNDKLTFGFYALHDDAGENAFKTTHFSLSASYSKVVGLTEFSAGLQGAYTFRTIDGEKYAFPEDFNRQIGSFDPTFSNMENADIDGANASNLDVNFGLAWKGNFDSFRPSVGLSGFHLVSSGFSFLSNNQEGDYKIPTRIVAHLSFKTYFNNLYVDPIFMLSAQAGVNTSIFGANVGYEPRPNNANIEEVYAGVLLRSGVEGNQDAFILRGGVVFGDFAFGAAYDFNISPLQEGVASNGSFEVSLSYTSPSTRLIKSKIESERL